LFKLDVGQDMQKSTAKEKAQHRLKQNNSGKPRQELRKGEGKVDQVCKKKGDINMGEKLTLGKPKKRGGCGKIYLKKRGKKPRFSKKNYQWCVVAKGQRGGNDEGMTGSWASVEAKKKVLGFQKEKKYTPGNEEKQSSI